MKLRSSFAYIVTATWLASCAHAPRAEGPTLDLVAEAPIAGRFDDVADRGNATALVGEGAIVTHDDATQTVEHARFTAVAQVPAPDGLGSWTVAVDREGKLTRVRDRGVLEDVRGRFGLADAKLSGVCALDGEHGAFFEKDELIIVGRGTARRFAIGHSSARACGGGKLAIAVAERVLRYDASKDSWRTFSLRADALALDAQGTLWASRGRALYRATSDELVLELELGSRVTSLVASGTRLWIGEGTQLGWLEGGRYSHARDLALDAATHFAAGRDGKLWVLFRDRARRVDAPAVTAESDASWSALVAPVVARSCGNCHRPGGRGGFDLRAESAWRSHLSAIRERVLDDRDMPPANAPITEDDRAALKRWLDAQR
jgi:mono/diheme cytochrome c family protein